uniref:Uncharacterized protein n=1 Tax=viral metagenome TaxID=1070528 RepID=A0A6C0LKX8_9ZZZZ
MKLHVPNHLIPISMGVFLALNMFENIIHFSIGRNIKEKDSSNIGNIEIPEYYDIIKIIVIMMVFAFLQAIFTYYFVITGY